MTPAEHLRRAADLFERASSCELAEESELMLREAKRICADTIIVLDDLILPPSTDGIEWAPDPALNELVDFFANADPPPRRHDPTRGNVVAIGRRREGR